MSSRSHGSSAGVNPHTRFLDHTLVQGGESYVVAVLEGIEEVAEQRVLDRRPERVFFEISLCDVCLVEGAAHQYSVPGLIFWRPTLRHLLVPLLTQREHRVHIDDDAPVVEELVMDELSNVVSGFEDDHQRP